MIDLRVLKPFFQALVDKPLDANDPRYVPLYQSTSLLPHDPVKHLARAIRYSQGQSVQLLSGYRGTGKTTELRRLEADLTVLGYKVIFVDMDDYLNNSTPIDISDFIMALAGAFGESLEAPDLLGKDATESSYWERVSSLLTKTKISLPEISAKGIKANLKNDPTFKELLQQRMQGHIGALVGDVHEFVANGVQALKKRHGEGTEVVFIVDSVEHIRGSYQNAAAVQASVELVFAGNAERLRLPYMHVIYTVPTYLKTRSMNIGQLYPYGAVQVFPAIKVRDSSGNEYQDGIEAMMKIVEQRGDWRQLLGNAELLKKLVVTSGGNIRGLFRLVSEVILRADTLPVDEQVVTDAINQIRTEFLPIAEDDAVWLARIEKEGDSALKALENLPQLTRFLDTHAVLCYRNGPEWYGVHPLIREHVERMVQNIEKRRKTEEEREKSK